MLIATLLLGILTPVQSFIACNQSKERCIVLNRPLSSTSSIVDDQEATAESELILRLQTEILSLGEVTNRGFDASRSKRQEAIAIIDQLAALNPTTEPASPYYDTTTYIPGPNICGKWTLVYTDAPDITSLASIPTAKLGRIGQDCTPPYVKNVIEWKRPEWADFLPFSGTSESRILQKVCTKATASPTDPLLLNLDVSGIELVADDGNNKDGASIAADPAAWIDALQTNGLPVSILQQAPLLIEGPLTAPFGKARILFLDERMRILRTQQNFVAVNVRSDPEWF
ncbi:PAP fibrillin [Fragilaria crotonensis]|nr:PAP fibrillin [Fragilaria crotonensis]